MTRPPTDREALIAALAEQARSGAPSVETEPEELLDYLAGRLSPEEEERLGRELAASPEAARALLDLEDLEAAGAAAGTRPAELAARAGWRDLQGHLPTPVPWFRRLPPILSSIAAVLLVATVGLSARLWRIQEPVANVQSLDLVSGSRAAGEERIALREGEPLNLVLRPAERCPRYEADVEGPGRNHQIVPGLDPNDRGNLTLLLQRVEPGSYGLRLYGCEPRRELETHRFRVTAR
jgi:anti-sigma factor RsiW